MKKLSSVLIILACFLTVYAEQNTNRNLEEDEVDNCFEFLTNIIPVRLENLKKPIDFHKDLLRLGYYQPRTKYEFLLCKEDDENDCHLRYSNDEEYVYDQYGDKEYKVVKNRVELHGRSIYRMHSYVFKYESVKLVLDEGFIKGENGQPDSCKDGYKICGKIHNNYVGQLTLLCFPKGADCPIKDIKGTGVASSAMPNHIDLGDGSILNFVRYTDQDYILEVFTGFYFSSNTQKDNVNNLPFEFAGKVGSRGNTIFTNDQIDLRELFKENNIYSHFLDFYLKDIPMNKNTTYMFQCSTKFDMIKDVVKKCKSKEVKEEYEFDNYDDDCLPMLANVYPIMMNSTEKLYERDVMKLTDFEPKFKYEHFLCKTTNKSDCVFRYSNNSEYEFEYYDRGYAVNHTKYIGDTAKPIYLYQALAFKTEKLTIHLKETFDISLYKCKDGYRECGRIRHHPWATIICVHKMDYCPINEIIGDMFTNDVNDNRKYPENFGYNGNAFFYFNRYKMNDTLRWVFRTLYLRTNYDFFYEEIPYCNVGSYVRGLQEITAYKNRVYNLEKIFTENGIPIDFVKYNFPDDNYVHSMYDDRVTRLYLSAEVFLIGDLELKCVEPSTNNQVILYKIWRDEKWGDQNSGSGSGSGSGNGNDSVENKDYFYKDEINNIYVSCAIINNCIKCISNTICTFCDEGYKVNENNLCSKIISDNDSDDNSLSTGAIIGIVFGCVVFLPFAALTGYYLYKKFYNKRQPKIGKSIDNKSETDLKNDEKNDDNNAGKENDEKIEEKNEKNNIIIHTTRRSIHNIKKDG